MLRFPNIANPSSYSEDIYDPVLSSEMEDTTTITRAKTTAQPKIYYLKWSALSNDDYIKFMDFYKETKGGSLKFIWTSFLTNEEHVVRFISKSKADFVQPFYWSFDISLSEK